MSAEQESLADRVGSWMEELAEAEAEEALALWSATLERLERIKSGIKAHLRPEYRRVVFEAEPRLTDDHFSFSLRLEHHGCSCCPPECDWEDVKIPRHVFRSEDVEAATSAHLAQLRAKEEKEKAHLRVEDARRASQNAAADAERRAAAAEQRAAANLAAAEEELRAAVAAAG